MFTWEFHKSSHFQTFGTLTLDPVDDDTGLGCDDQHKSSPSSPSSTPLEVC